MSDTRKTPAPSGLNGEADVNSETIRPLGDRVLVRRAAEEKVTASGLVLPDRSTDIPKRGTVLRLGKCRKSIYDRTPEAVAEELEYRVSFQVQVGDTVYFNKYGGIEVEAGGETLLLISEEEILAFTRGE